MAGGGGGGGEHREEEEEEVVVARGEEIGVSHEDEAVVATVRWGLVVSDSGCSCSG